MDTVTTILLIIVPYVLYKLVLYYLEQRHDIEINKWAKSMIFFIVDVLILVIASSIGK